jgi:hypothetical protein
LATLEEKISQLPPEIQKEVGDFIDFLLMKYTGESLEIG